MLQRKITFLGKYSFLIERSLSDYRKTNVLGNSSFKSKDSLTLYLIIVMTINILKVAIKGNKEETQYSN